VNLDIASPPRAELSTAIKRGLMERCPVCGKGKLFRSYLKLSETCSSCGENLGAIRADDGPAWATILIVGHLMVPFLVLAVRADVAQWVCFSVLLPLTLVLTLVLLPRVKGAFAAVLWSLGMPSGVPAGIAPTSPAA
jgi:uncharacterized protein (DUF983 family)